MSILSDVSKLPPKLEFDEKLKTFIITVYDTSRYLSIIPLRRRPWEREVKLNTFPDYDIRWR
jgi:hypothetical protein